MKVLVTTTLVAAALLNTNVALAKSQDGKEIRSDRYYSERQYTDRQHKNRQHHRDQRRYQQEPLRLNIPVRVRGDARIHLRRLIRNQGYNPNHYTLRKVVVNNKGHYRASAHLRVGNKVTHRRLQHKGKTHIHAPARNDGRWVLALDNARVNHLRVVLEPKYDWAHNRGHRQPVKPWFRDHHTRW
jgi:hypothetical protein